MASKLRLPPSSVVANGVDVELAQLPQEGDDQLRIVLLGNFFDGRTDYDLIEAISRIDGLDEIVVGGLASSGNKSHDRIRSILRGAHAQVKEYEWLDSASIAGLSGSRTVGLIPHVVTDYTVSQNLMKAFQLIALGLPILCPLLLWPSEIDVRFGYLLSHGASLETTLVPWMKASDRPDEAYRSEFVKRHSWRSRGEAIAERLCR